MVSKKANYKTVKCSVPQGSILGPLDLLDPIIFADDTNFFNSNKGINTVFVKVNDELQRIKEWFISNKLSRNLIKTNYSFFHKPSKKYDIPLVLLKPNINNYDIAKA